MTSEVYAYEYEHRNIKLDSPAVSTMSVLLELVTLTIVADADNACSLRNVLSEVESLSSSTLMHQSVNRRSSHLPTLELAG